MSRGSLYSASDKAVFDALNQSSVTNSDMKELFLSRGIIVAKDTSRENLAKYFSRMTHDFDDYQLLARLLGTTQRREKTTATRITEEVSFLDIEAAAVELCEKINCSDVNANVESSENKIEIKVKYQATNFNRSEFKQVVDKEAVIEIEKDDDGGYLIRYPSNPEVENWKDIVIFNLEEALEKEVNASVISLEHISGAEIRTRFFVDVIHNMSGFEYFDVTDVYVYHPKESDQEKNDEGEDVQESINFGVHIHKASLKGQGVLQSAELKELYQRGFYISKIVWQAKRSGEIDSDLYVFESQFSEPENCRYFSYLTKGFHRYKADGEYNKSRTACALHEEKQINKLIEKAAQVTLALINSENINGGGGDENQMD